MQVRTKKTEYIILAIILLAGLVLRGSYLLEIVKNPDFEYPTTDAALNDHWARGIADDDWSVKHDRDPEIRTTPYFRPPGYAHFLSLIYMSSGSSYLAVRIVQMSLGLLNCVLAYLLGRYMFGRTTGLILAALMSVYWIFIYFEGELLAPSLVIFGTLIMMHVLFLWINKFSYVRGIAAGITIGLLALIRTNVLLFIPAVLAWAWWLSRRKKDGRRLHTVAIGFLAACLLTICPVTIRNYRVANDFVLISTNAGINFYMGNNEEADGWRPHIPHLMELTGLDRWGCFSYPYIARSVEKLQGHPMKHSEVSSYFTSKALDYIRKNPGRSIQLILKKILLFWGPAEIPNNKELSSTKDQSLTLKYLPGFSAAVATATMGLLMLILSLRKKQADNDTSDFKRLWQQETSVLVVLFIVCYFASYLPFFITARFRVAVIPFLLLFGAYGIFRIYQYVLGHNPRKAVCWLIVGIGLFLLGQIQIIPYQPDLARWHFERGELYLLKEQFEQALQEYRKAVEADPWNPWAHDGLARTLSIYQNYPEAITHFSQALKIKPDFMGARIHLATVYHEQKQYDLTMEQLFIALEMNPNYAKVYNFLGEIYFNKNQFDQAIKQFNKAIEIEPENTGLYNFLATVYQKQDNYEQAIKQLNKSIEIDPEQFGAYGHLGQIYFQQKNYEQALFYAQKSLSINSEQPVVLNQLAALYNRQKKPGKVIECFNESLQIAPKQPSVMNELATALYGQNKVTEAMTLWSDSLVIDPNQVYAANSLAWIKATSKDARFYNPGEALTLARRACELIEYKDPGMLDTLAAALAANRDFTGAVETAQKAIDTAISVKDDYQIAVAQKHLQLYKNKQALRE